MENISTKHLSDYQAGDTFVFKFTVTEKMVDDFASLSGDYSTIHMDDTFARSRGFSRRVVHGVLLMCTLSRLVGMHLPGENAILQMIEARFVLPAYIDDELLVVAEVDQISSAAKCMILKASIKNIVTEKIILKSKIQVGFTGKA